MLKYFTVLGATIIIAAIVVSPAFAVLAFDQNVTPAVINGTGNNNGGFTTDRANGIELGIRGKLRFDANNDPQDIYNSNGAGTYTFSTGTPNLSGPNLPSWATTTTPVWNWDWSVNSNFDGTGQNLALYNYRMNIDFDPGFGTTNFLSFDPINQASADHAVGTNATGPGGGTVNPALYAGNILVNNVAQNSWNMEFFNAPATPFTFDPNAIGEYTIQLVALDKNTNAVLASVSVNVVAVPEASACIAGLLICGIVGGGWSIRRFFGRESV